MELPGINAPPPPPILCPSGTGKFVRYLAVAQAFSSPACTNPNPRMYLVDLYFWFNGVNVAAGKPAVGSPSIDEFNYGPDKALDDDLGTAFIAEPANTTGEQYWRVDLGVSRGLRDVQWTLFGVCGRFLRPLLFLVPCCCARAAPFNVGVPYDSNVAHQRV
jgi:hypothetical protein